jgi:hypothetical protein
VIFLSLSVLLNQVSVRVMAEPVLKFNTAVLRCQVPQNAALYTKIQSWQRGNTIIYPTSKGGKKFFKDSNTVLPHFMSSWGEGIAF